MRFFGIKIAAVYLVLAVATGLSANPAAAQEDDFNPETDPALKSKSGVTAFGLSILVPGLGQRYVNSGRWGTAGTIFLGLDLTLWLGLATSVSQEDHFIDGYTSLVADRTGNTLEGKNRSFELALSAYDSSDEYLDALLRSRQWDRIEGAQDPANQWDWESEADRRRYVELRSDADAASNRTSAIVGALIVNRLISGITAALSSRGAVSQPPNFSAALGYSRYSDWPTAVVAMRF